MGFSGFKIPGHSGTEFKHKKVFARRREIPSAPTMDTTYSHEQREAFRQDLAVRLNDKSGSFSYNLILSIIKWFLLLFMIAVVQLSYSFFKSRLINTYAKNPTIQLKIDYEIEGLKFSNKMGDYYLRGNNFEEASIEFSRALTLDPYSKAANLGMTKSLVGMCEEKHWYCAMADTYQSFIEAEFLITKMELNNIKSVIEK